MKLIFVDSPLSTQNYMPKKGSKLHL